VKLNPIKLRNFAALLAALSGTSQAASLWFLPTTPQLLLTALCGACYLLLFLGLLGVGRLTLLLAILLPLLRVWFGLWPLPIEAWEQLRVLFDIAIALTCVPVLWHSLHPGQIAGAAGTEAEHA
jgi:hypothetical protein